MRVDYPSKDLVWNKGPLLILFSRVGVLQATPDPTLRSAWACLCQGAWHLLSDLHGTCCNEHQLSTEPCVCCQLAHQKPPLEVRDMPLKRETLLRPERLPVGGRPLAVVPNLQHGVIFSGTSMQSTLWGTGHG